MQVVPWLMWCCAVVAPDVVLLDFSADWCGPCRKMRPVVQQLAAAGYPVREVDIDREPALARNLRVDSVPCFVLMVEGREQGRIVGLTSYEKLVGLFADARAANLAANAPPARQENVAAVAASNFPARREPFAPSPAVPVRTAAFPAPSPAAAPGDLAAGASAAPGDLAARASAASVKLTIDEGATRSRGSGTVIDSQDREALVLTCGHIFRDGQGKGTVTVDFTGPAHLRGLPARVIGYDLKSDLGLLVVEVPQRVPHVPVAPTGYDVRAGADVLSLGYPQGGPLDLLRTRINSKNKIVGPPNLQVAGLPIEGRSGGGLVSADGYVIGVCNAADPERQEGLFAALEAIHTALDHAGLTELHRTSAPAATVAANPPAPSVFPAAALADSRAAAPADSLSADERAVLERLRGANGQADVICVVRSPEAPQGEVVVIERASAEFRRRLDMHRRGESESPAPNGTLPTNSVVPSVRPAIRPAFR